MLSRFDLMFIVLDNVDAESDRHVANHVLSSHQYRFRDQDTSIKSVDVLKPCLLYTSPSPRDRTRSRMPSSA